MVKTVYAGRRDHLGTCLMNLANAWRFAQATDAEFIAWWPKTRFEREEMSLEALYPHLPFPVVDTLPRVDLVLDRNKAPDRVDAALLSDAATVHYEVARLLRLGGENRSAGVATARSLARSLELDPSISEAVQSIAAATGIENKLAVHLRRGDIITLMTGDLPVEKCAALFAARYADLGAYVDAIGERDAVAFSDDPAEVERLTALLPGQIVSMAGCAELTRHLSSHRKDMVEILVMARAKEIIGPRSNFSGFSAFYGDRRFVDVRKFLKPKRLARELLAVFEPDVVRHIVAAYEPYFRRHGREAAWKKLSDAAHVERGGDTAAR